MRLLFIHQNYPGQYALIARAFHEAGHAVTGLTRRPAAPEPYPVHRYEPAGHPQAPHPFLVSTDEGIRNGQAVARWCRNAARQGYRPDAVIGHTGWGELLFLKDVWPEVPLIGCCEYYYRSEGADFGFDPLYPQGAEDALRLRVLNSVALLSLEAIDVGHTATQWQKSLFPAEYQDKIRVCHEGVDARRIQAGAGTAMTLPDGTVLGPGDPVVTFVARNLEPYRGFHMFMRALPRVLRGNPRAQVVVVGGDAKGYGPLPGDGGSWRQALMRDVGASLDGTRVHFLGTVPYEDYLRLLGVSAAHVYLTYPFVLSWSLIEAMAARCLIVGSRTAPVMEVIRDGINGRLVDFFDPDGLAAAILEALASPAAALPLRRAAGATAMQRYDFPTVCFPRFQRMVTDAVDWPCGGLPWASPRSGTP